MGQVSHQTSLEGFAGSLHRAVFHAQLSQTIPPQAISFVSRPFLSQVQDFTYGGCYWDGGG